MNTSDFGPIMLGLIYGPFLLIAFYFAFKRPSKKWQEKAKLRYEISQKKEEEKKQTEEEKALARKNEIFNRELNRTQREMFSIDESFGLKIIIPYIISIALLLIGIYFYFHDKTIIWYLFIPIFLLSGLNLFLEDLREDWNLALACKKKIYEENNSYPFYDGYSYDRIYTDSGALITIFNFINIFLWLLNTICILGIICLAFYWISSININSTEAIAAIFIAAFLLKDHQYNKKFEKLSNKIEALQNELNEIRGYRSYSKNSYEKLDLEFDD